jgi:hypothetical protein
MLANKSFIDGDIICIKLVNGEEIIATFKSIEPDKLNLLEPFTLTMNEKGLGMVPFMVLAEPGYITINRSHVVTIVSARKDAVDSYANARINIAKQYQGN